MSAGRRLDAFSIQDCRVESSSDYCAEIDGDTIDDVTDTIRGILRNGR